jgi:hypothetical protein
MLRHVAVVRTDVSKEQIASIIRTTRSSEMSVLIRVTLRNTQQDGILHGHRRENIALTGWTL